MSDSLQNQRETNRETLIRQKFTLVLQNLTRKVSLTSYPLVLRDTIWKFYQIKLNSSILTSEKDVSVFYDMIHKELRAKNDELSFKLLYQASKYNYSVNKFHQLCDNKGPTITIILTEENNIFLGYAKKSWFTPSNKDSFEYIKDKKSFICIFRLNNKCKVKLNEINNNLSKYYLKTKLEFPIILSCYNTRAALLCIYDRGPSFGSGNDLGLVYSKRDNPNLRSANDFIVKRLEVNCACDYYFKDSTLNHLSYIDLTQLFSGIQGTVNVKIKEYEVLKVLKHN